MEFENKIAEYRVVVDTDWLTETVLYLYKVNVF